MKWPAKRVQAHGARYRLMRLSRSQRLGGLARWTLTDWTIPRLKHHLCWPMLCAWYFTGAEAAGKQRSWLGPSQFILGAPSPRAYMGLASADDFLYVFGGVYGGWIGESEVCFNDLYRFNPYALEWTDLSAQVNGAPPSPRSSPGFSSLNGKLFVFGGSLTDQNAVLVNDLYLFDPSKLSWTDLTAHVHGAPPIPRFGFGCASAIGKLFVFGGSIGAGKFNDFYSFDPSALLWEDLSSQVHGTPPSPRSNLGFTSADDKLFVFGGWEYAEVYYNDVHRFDPSTLVWTEFTEQIQGTLPSPRDILEFSSVGGELFLFGGSNEEGGYFPAARSAPSQDLFRFDPSTLTWIDLTMQAQGAAPLARVAHGFTSTKSKLFLFGGSSQTDDLNDFYCLDPSTLVWKNLSGDFDNAPPSARAGQGVASADGKLFVFGGWNESGTLNDFFRFDTSALSWTELSAKTYGASPSSRYGLGFSSSGQKLFVYGGWNESGFLNDLFCCDISSSTWTNLSQGAGGLAPSPRFLHGFASDKDKLYVFGGWGTSGYLNDLFHFDLSTLSWTFLSHQVHGTSPSPRFGHGFTVANGNIFVFGGDDQSGVLNDLYAFDPSILSWTNLSESVDSISPGARSGHGFTSTNKQLFVFGGFKENGLPYAHDLYMFDCLTLAWMNITNQIHGEMPTVRYNFGFIVIEERLFILGGMNSDGVLFDDVMTLIVPSDVIWKSIDGAHSMIEVYDWDTVSLNSSAKMNLDWRLTLCTQIFPCTLSLRTDGGAVFSSQGGSISCLASLGCTGMSLDSLLFVCDESVALVSLLEVEGTMLYVRNSSFKKCTSLTTGGVVNAYKNASVTIESSVFQDIMSLGSGGAISAAGAILVMESSKFENCSSLQGGGAVWFTTIFCPCSESTGRNIANMQIDSTVFEGCSSDGAGGAILTTGEQVYSQITGSVFIRCTSKTTGGAVAVDNGANTTVSNSTFVKNSADGVGGGAFYLESASLSMEDLQCVGNTALNGGGGVLYSHVAVQLEIAHLCNAGWFKVVRCGGAFSLSSCLSCDAGKYQSAQQMSFCSLCSAGTFSSGRGATSDDSCISCLSGKYSTIVGANDSAICNLCEPGSYASGGTSYCSSCRPGTYSSIAGASLCLNCGAGTFATVVNALTSAACLICQAGTYSHRSSSECLQCPAGKFLTSAEASSVRDCLSCAAGKFSNVTGADSAASCLLCRQGTFSPHKYFAYEFVPLSWSEAEDACMESGGHLASINSEEENREVLSLLNLYPFDYWIGFHYNVTRGNWSWTDGSETAFEGWAAQNPKSGSSSYGCTSFPAYQVPFAHSGLFEVWPVFTEVYGFIPSSMNLSSPSGSWYNFECDNKLAWVNGYVCAFTGATVCTECNAGEYSNVKGSTASSICLTCPIGTYSDLAGASSCTACSTLDNSSNTTYFVVDECHRETAVRQYSLEIGTGQPSIAWNSKLQLIELDDVSNVRLRSPFKNTVSHQPTLPRFRTMLSSKISGAETVKQTEQVYSSKKSVRKDSYYENFRNTNKLFGRALLSTLNFMAELISSENLESQMCGPGNQAVYGPCLASSYDSLQVLDSPNRNTPAYPGLPFTLTILKRDAYQQTISTDSSSVLQVKSTSEQQGSLGTFAATLQAGSAVLSIILKPTFAVMEPSTGVTELGSPLNLFISGQDSLFQATTLQSEVFQIFFSSNNSICPMGYILTLDQRGNSSSKVGSCSECATGTYSISPLAGYSRLVPSCFNCPAGAMTGSCKGGSEVLFSLGTWIVSDGFYKLISCPAGHELVNNLNGQFSHDIQQCLACQPNEYILDSNNPNFACQKCPIGAVCDGIGLRGLVNGSTWEVENTTGYYQLTSCPPRYELLNAAQDLQQCSLCPASSYCTGGSEVSKACPQGSFSFPGGNSSSSCFKAVYVEISVTLPVTKNEFDELQQSFLVAVAAAARASASQVAVDSISGTRRSQVPRDAMFCGPIEEVDETRWLFNTIENDNLIPLETNLAKSLLAESSRAAFRTALHHLRASVAAVEVVTTIAAEDGNGAAAFMSNLNLASLNAELEAHGLPQGSLNWIRVQSSSVAGGSGPILSVAVGGSIAGFVFLLALLTIGYFVFRRIRVLAARASFVAAMRTAQVGDEASSQHLPYELRGLYEAQEVIGKGAFGCVVHAKTRSGGPHVAIKLIIPEKGIFLESQLRQLVREAAVLEKFTAHKSDHVVQLTGFFAIHVYPDLCWFVMEYLRGENLEDIIRDKGRGPISDKECIKVGRNILAVLKVMHADGLVHRDIKPANIMRIKHESPDLSWDGQSYTYKMVDFGTAVGVDETIAIESMMTLADNRHMGVGTLPYMSPEMFLQPETAHYPTDLWSLGVTMFELVTAQLPFKAESDLLMGLAVAGDLNVKAPSVLDKLSDDCRSSFDHNLAKVISTALEKRVANRFQSSDEMHEALYLCLIHRQEASYSVFISYRVASEAPLARLLFDELNHSVTPGGHRVTIYWDAHRLVNGDNWEEGFATGLLNSLCFFPLLSYGATAPLAEFPQNRLEGPIADVWDERPCGRARLTGSVSDAEDNFLKEVLIAIALLEHNAEINQVDPELRGKAGEGGLLQLAYPILVGRQHPPKHPHYPRMGSFFEVQAGGGTYPHSPSPATNAAAVRFLSGVAGVTGEALVRAGERTVAACIETMMMLQGCQLWSHPPLLQGVELTREQKGLLGKGCAGPAMALGGIPLSAAQQDMCRQGLDEKQLEMLKAQVRNQRGAFHDVIDRAVYKHEQSRNLCTGRAVLQTERRRSAAASRAQAAGGHAREVTADVVMPLELSSKEESTVYTLFSDMKAEG